MSILINHNQLTPIGTNLMWSKMVKHIFGME